MRKRWLTITVICVAFIFFQSIIPEGKSARESLWFTTKVLNPILSKLGFTLSKETVRKIAHAIEFCILSLFVFLWLKKPVKSFYVGFTCAFLDESIQVLTKRGALIKDVWIDLAGVVAGILIGFFIMQIKRKCSSRSEKRRNINV